MANVTIVTIPLGSQLTSTIARDEPDSKNDFDVLFLWDENVELSQSKVSVSSGSSIVAFEGRHCVRLKCNDTSAADGWNCDGDGRGKCSLARESSDE